MNDNRYPPEPPEEESSWTSGDDELPEEDWEEQEEYPTGEEEFSEEIRQPWTQWDSGQEESGSGAPSPKQPSTTGPGAGENVRPLPPRPPWDRRTEGVGEDADDPSARTPWDRRKEVGIIEGIIDSCRMLLFRPSTFFRQLSPKGGFGEPLLFFILFCVLFSLFAFPSDMISRVIQTKIGLVYLEESMQVFERFNLPPEFTQALEMELQKSSTLLNIFFKQLCCSAANPVRWLIVLFVLAAFYAVLGILFGGKLDYETAFRVLVFAHVAHCSMIINPIPYFRDLVFLIHWIILLTIGFKHLGQISTGRAFLLALSPILLILFFVCCCWCGLFSVSLAAISG